MTNPPVVRLSTDQSVRSLQAFFRVSLSNLGAFAVVAYFSGWHYVNAYFSFFNVNRSSFTFDNYTIFLYCFFVLVKVPANAGRGDKVSRSVALAAEVIAEEKGSAPLG